MSWYSCADCDFMDIADKNRYGEAYCSLRHAYYNPSDTACNKASVKGRSVGDVPRCYITTCVCDILGKDDNCDTLDTLRFLRDSFMRKRVDYYSMLKEYDVVGPQIAYSIYNDPRRDMVANWINFCYLESACSRVKDNDYDSAIDLYIEMTNSLLGYYNISDRYNESNVDDEIKLFDTRKRAF